MDEVETKILNVNRDELAGILNKIGAKKILETKLIVDWFRPKGEKEGEENWFLRVRTYGGGRAEVTWKGKSSFLGGSRKHKEINFTIGDAHKIGDLFLELGLEKYAHQEKFRASWTYKDWRLDLDQYPGMPVYLEIEGKNEKHIQDAISLLKLQNREVWNQGDGGERILIQSKYGLDWYSMSFEQNEKN